MRLSHTTDTIETLDSRVSVKNHDLVRQTQSLSLSLTVLAPATHIRRRQI